MRDLNADRGLTNASCFKNEAAGLRYYATPHTLDISEAVENACWIAMSMTFWQYFADQRICYCYPAASVLFFRDNNDICI